MAFRLADIPVEVLLDNFLPLLPILDLLSLSSTNRFFYNLCNDDTFWKRKIRDDFNFPCDVTARSSGWKFIYRGLSRPLTYVWGEATKGRLGTVNPSRSNVGHVPWPIQLRIGHPRVRIVDLSAAGMSFFAIDSEGNLYAWGTLNGLSFAPPTDEYSSEGKTATTPKLLKLPVSTRAISCGRLHATTLDENFGVWTFLSFGRPFRLATPFLDLSSPEAFPHQIASGWTFSAVLTKSGSVYVWFPWGERLQREITRQNELMDQAGQTTRESEQDTIPCVTWDLHEDPHKLPSLPSLPPLIPGRKAGDVYLIKIAGLEHHLVGLTNHGHVLKFHLEDHLSRLSTWEYLPQFSDPDKIKGHVTSVVPQLRLPDDILITHISAQFRTFVAYSTGTSSVVLMGTSDTTVHTEPQVIPTLQNRSVISVVVGDYHYGALTSTGQLLTWGEFSHGALGLGDPTTITPGQPGGYASEQQRRLALERGAPFPPRVTEPAEVKFDSGEKRRRERFCFAATAAGWHTGALAIDLEPDEEEEEESLRMPGGFPPSQGHTHDRSTTAMRPPGLSIFRIGYAGRGRSFLSTRGRGS